MKLLDDSAVVIEEGTRLDAIRAAVASFNAMSIDRIDSLAGRVLMAPLVDSITGYFKDILLGLYKEGGKIATSAASTTTLAENQNPDCSKAVQLVLKQFPEVVAVHLSSLPRHPAVVWALEECCRRLLALYVSVVVLLRPVTEMSRLRAAADMTALELMISSLQSQDTSRFTGHSKRENAVALNDPVRAEFKALRRLLFDEKAVVSGSAKGNDKNSKSGNAAPAADIVLSLPYVSAMRPSTLLGYLMACGPTQVRDTRSPACLST